MKRIALLFVLIAGLAATPVARSQQPGSKTPTSGKHDAQVDDSLKFKASPELQKSLDDLAAAMQALALRIANDPEIKAAAIHVASGLVNTATQVVTEHSVVIQEALKTAGERIAAAQSAPHPRAKRP